MNKYIDFLNSNIDNREVFLPLWKAFKADLNSGRIRVAEKTNNEWAVNTWVKQFILKGFKYGERKVFDAGYIDKDTLGEKEISLNDNIRTVSHTTSIRDGVYIGKNVTFMPPNYTNIGAYIDDGSMVDSLVLVGSCAQIGKNVHLGAGVIIGGVLEPVGSLPVIIEDNVFMGANACITEGAIVKKGAIIGAGVTITGSTPIYDKVNNVIIKPNQNGQIIIPENAVVVPGSREIETEFSNKLSINTPIIVKYDASVELEDLLR